MANTITAEVREAKNPREMRRAGQIPAVIYGRGYHREISLPGKRFEKVLQKATRSSKIEIDLGGETVNTFIKEIQYHPLNDSILHIDFFRPADDQIIKMEIPIKFSGEPKGRRKGGAVNRVRDFIEIRGSGDVIPPIFEADITELEVGDKIRAADIELPEGSELITPPEVLLLQVAIQRRSKAEIEDDEAEAAAEAAETAAEAGTAPTSEDSAPAETEE